MSIVYQLPDPDYRERPELSASKVCDFGSTTPYKFRYGERKESPALLLGQITHHIALTPDVKPFWAVKPEGMSFATKDGKAWRDQHAGEAIIAEADYNSAAAIGEAFRQAWRRFHKASFAAFESDPKCREVSVFAGHRKCRCDVLLDGVIVDLKTCADSSIEGFGRACVDYHYLHKAAWYLDTCKDAGANATTFLWVAVEKAQPYEANVYWINDNDPRLDIARADLRRWESALTQCMTDDVWPTSTGGAGREVKTPLWAFKEHV